MPVPRFQFSPIYKKHGRGSKVHAIGLHEPTKTACGRDCQGWILAVREKVNCMDCKLRIFRRRGMR